MATVILSTTCQSVYKRIDKKAKSWNEAKQKHLAKKRFKRIKITQYLAHENRTKEIWEHNAKLDFVFNK